MWTKGFDTKHHQFDSKARIWNFPVDNEFATTVFERVGRDFYSKKVSRPTLLCSKCRELDILDPNFYVVDTWKELDDNHTHCDFCNLRRASCKDLNRQVVPTLRFERDSRNQSTLKLNEGDMPVLSICRDPGMHELFK
jgi:hypothetical protein